MGKKRGRSQQGSSSGWTAADQAARERPNQRRALLAHDTVHQRSDLQLRLHLTKTRRHLAQLKERLQAWDPVEEGARWQKAQAAAQQEEAQPKPKWRRPGPETWKLKGPARPASEVYDFDVRYVDPHEQAHQKARDKISRQVNLLVQSKGRFGVATAADASVADQARVTAMRDYLGELMQLGHLSLEAQQFKSARAAFLECIELEEDRPLTTARESLMRLYLERNRHDAVLRLGERFPDDPSPWMRYSLALVAHQEGRAEAERLLVEAIRTNLWCAFYLAFYDTFAQVMEYTEDLSDQDDGPQSSLEEAIEYCSSANVADAWIDAGGAKALKECLAMAAQGRHASLTSGDVDWKSRLEDLEKAFREQKEAEGDVPTDGPEGESIDRAMFLEMYRTAMEMVTASEPASSS